MNTIYPNPNPNSNPNPNKLQAVHSHLTSPIFNINSNHLTSPIFNMNSNLLTSPIFNVNSKPQVLILSHVALTLMLAAKS